ncbi:hypothetical protein PPL_03675 [Heterostelium album PN500]|uniref:Uncharacterized protein n=1 Tax=Heterostelium pallidum (strain ATCC 26659 / Pp 5 / PN500) TaxID=670386 RepID=D3B6C7_HETP5|nr:hypothetical protein PPL_03675 [Heterostelium album PN500]EFA82897.1 hypothetical protein PPL_03675 [Heterostelium album PN500]|eukprot:XP_020435014.1 hypothetical protein PPL_03675 [Heterostelium album PN500]
MEIKSFQAYVQDCQFKIKKVIKESSEFLYKNNGDSLSLIPFFNCDLFYGNSSALNFNIKSIGENLLNEIKIFDRLPVTFRKVEFSTIFVDFGELISLKSEYYDLASIILGEDRFKEMKILLDCLKSFSEYDFENDNTEINLDPISSFLNYSSDLYKDMKSGSKKIRNSSFQFINQNIILRFVNSINQSVNPPLMEKFSKPSTFSIYEIPGYSRDSKSISSLFIHKFLDKVLDKFLKEFGIDSKTSDYQSYPSAVSSTKILNDKISQLEINNSMEFNIAQCSIYEVKYSIPENSSPNSDFLKNIKNSLIVKPTNSLISHYRTEFDKQLFEYQTSYYLFNLNVRIERFIYKSKKLIRILLKDPNSRLPDIESFCLDRLIELFIQPYTQFEYEKFLNKYYSLVDGDRGDIRKSCQTILEVAEIPKSSYVLGEYYIVLDSTAKSTLQQKIGKSEGPMINPIVGSPAKLSNSNFSGRASMSIPSSPNINLLKSLTKERDSMSSPSKDKGLHTTTNSNISNSITKSQNYIPPNISKETTPTPAPTPAPAPTTPSPFPAPITTETTTPIKVEPIIINTPSKPIFEKAERKEIRYDTKKSSNISSVGETHIARYNTGRNPPSSSNIFSGYYEHQETLITLSNQFKQLTDITEYLLTFFDITQNNPNVSLNALITLYFAEISEFNECINWVKRASGLRVIFGYLHQVNKKWNSKHLTPTINLLAFVSNITKNNEVLTLLRSDDITKWQSAHTINDLFITLNELVDKLYKVEIVTLLITDIVENLACCNDPEFNRKLLSCGVVSTLIRVGLGSGSVAVVVKFLNMIANVHRNNGVFFEKFEKQLSAVAYIVMKFLVHYDEQSAEFIEMATPYSAVLKSSSVVQDDCNRAMIKSNITWTNPKNKQQQQM